MSDLPSTADEADAKSVETNFQCDAVSWAETASETPSHLKLSPRRQCRVTWNIALINASSGIDGWDDQLLPASFRALESELAFHPSDLGYISLAQTCALALSSPLWGVLVDRFRRNLLLGIGCMAWGVVTIGLGAVSKLWEVILLRCLNGVFLACVAPISQSILADVVKPRSRGLAFGWVQASSCLGRIVGSLLTTSLSMLVFLGVSVRSINMHCNQL